MRVYIPPLQTHFFSEFSESVSLNCTCAALLYAYIDRRGIVQHTGNRDAMPNYGKH